MSHNLWLINVQIRRYCKLWLMLVEMHLNRLTDQSELIFSYLDFPFGVLSTPDVDGALFLNCMFLFFHQTLWFSLWIFFSKYFRNFSKKFTIQKGMLRWVLSSREKERERVKWSKRQQHQTNIWWRHRPLLHFGGFFREEGVTHWAWHHHIGSI